MAPDEHNQNILPPGGPLDIAGLELSPGRRIRATRGLYDGPQVDVMWMTDRRQSDTGAKWWTLQDQKNLRPVLLDELSDHFQIGERRPWDSELMVWDTEVPGPKSVSKTLKQLWIEDDDLYLREQLSPFTRFPGLAVAEPRPLQEVELELAAKFAPDAWLGLVPAPRAADIPLNIGWFASSEAFAGQLSPSAFTAVLRSWEDRFGATVFRLGFGRMQLLVKRPPTTAHGATAIAGELFCVATEFQNSQGNVINTVNELAESILQSPWWTFWWD